MDKYKYIYTLAQIQPPYWVINCLASCSAAMFQVEKWLKEGEVDREGEEEGRRKGGHRMIKVYGLN